MSPVELRCEYQKNPLAISAKSPRLSWRIGQGAQTAYQIWVASSAEKLSRAEPDLWDSGRVEGEMSVLMPYGGRKLRSKMICWWQVRVWNEKNQISSFSSPACWEMGLLSQHDWQDAQWIAMPENPEWVSIASTQYEASPIFRKRFFLEKPPTRARAYICGLGYHELYLNGSRVGNHCLEPAFTAYHKRALYVTHDVTPLLQQGENAVGVMLGNGWFNLHTIENKRFFEAPWRDRPQVLVLLEVVYGDGSLKRVVTDITWKSSPGPVVFDSIRNGEFFDARRDFPGWSLADFEDQEWRPVLKAKGPKGRLEPQNMPPCRVIARVRPKEIVAVGRGQYLVDFGRLMAGHACLNNVAMHEGAEVLLRYTERSDESVFPKQRGSVPHVPNDVYVFSGSFQTDRYTAGSDRHSSWEPRFSHHGFRYVRLEGLRRVPSRKAIEACEVHTDFERVGSFACSSPLLNQLQSMSERSFLSNFCGYPSDCPAREKAGWTGDGVNGVVGAMYSFNCASAYTKWLKDLRDTQREDGLIAAIAPTAGWGYQRQFRGPAWLIQYFRIPWQLYCYCGDKQVIEEHYDALCRLADFYKREAKGHLIDFGLADWLCPNPAAGWHGSSPLLYSSAHYYKCLLLLVQMAQLMGDEVRKKALLKEASAVRKAINQQLYDTKTGKYAGGTQSDQACALGCGIPEAGEVPRVMDRLTEAIRECRGHFDTGVIATGMLLEVLSRNGRADLAYGLVTRRGYPGFAWWVDQGATTLWERWDGTASRNHSSYCNLTEWFYAVLAGICPDPAHPAFKVTHFIPHPAGSLQWVRAAHHSPYGEVCSEWHRSRGGRVSLRVVVPPNAEGVVHLPGQVGKDGRVRVGSGTHCFKI